MKYVAYCGGVTITFRVEDVLQQAGGGVLPLAAAGAGASAALHNGVTWGLVSTRPCPALAAQTSSSSNSTFPAGAGAAPGRCIGSPVESIHVDNPSRKPLYVICGASAPPSPPPSSSSARPAPHDVLCIDLAPREGGQPVILATLRLNGEVLLQQSLPCSSISLLQMYPFVTLGAGAGTSLYEATTPSPLFTWFPAAGNPLADTVLGELDTSVRYQSSPSSLAHAQAHLGAQADFFGSATFSSGRHRCVCGWGGGRPGRAGAPGRAGGLFRQRHVQQRQAQVGVEVVGAVWRGRGNVGRWWQRHTRQRQACTGVGG